MRANPADYRLISPAHLTEALNLLDREPDRWLPLAGGTEIMVQYSAGRLGSRQLLNIGGLPELKQISETGTVLRIGGGCTFTQLAHHSSIKAHFPLLATAASWTGSIANQNRATIAGNIVNASPAADSPPALLAYEAELELISASGTRIVPYSEFHLSYKKTVLRPAELVLAILLPKRFDGWFGYTQKVGTRRAQAISKICIAGVGKHNGRRVQALQIGIGAVAPVPIRLRKIEAALIGAELTDIALEQAQCRLLEEISPIDDIRSSAEYRKRVAANLLNDLLQAFAAAEASQ